jgi:hypothetical protein
VISLKKLIDSNQEELLRCTIAEMFARADAEMYKEKKAVGRVPTPA